MSENRRMTSTAVRINRSFTLRLISLLFWVNLFVLLLVTVSWCYAQEREALGSAWQPNLRRSISISAAEPWYEWPGTMDYAFQSSQQQEAYTVQGAPFFRQVARLFVALLSAEALLILSDYGAGRRKAERLLTPLRRMAETAQNLDKTFDTRKYHDLEESISQLDVGTENARIETGDRDLKGMEDAINGLLRRTQEAYRQQTRFVSDASHELRTPIAVIRGYADMLDRWGKNDEKVRDEAIAAILKEADGMQRLVEQLLFLSRGDSGRQHLDLQRVSLTQIAREICEEMQLVDPERPFILQDDTPVYARGDAGMLKQAARILAENAMRYSAAGEHITLRAFINDKEESCLTVQDNGIGMRPEDVPHIFERFYRSDKARKREGGTGLGLAIAKWIADAHDAYFDVITREGVGTRITLCLPPCPQTPQEN
ncbi:MAG: sensor histidine kinase [Clostridia bacterium]|nr:sensor histidine kinase [Clostridia bacterium]